MLVLPANSSIFRADPWFVNNRAGGIRQQCSARRDGEQASNNLQKSNFMTLVNGLYLIARTGLCSDRVVVRWLLPVPSYIRAGWNRLPYFF
jgi:hypothetical protein